MTRLLQAFAFTTLAWNSYLGRWLQTNFCHWKTYSLTPIQFSLNDRFIWSTICLLYLQFGTPRKCNDSAKRFKHQLCWSVCLCERIFVSSFVLTAKKKIDRPKLHLYYSIAQTASCACVWIWPKTAPYILMQFLSWKIQNASISEKKISEPVAKLWKFANFIACNPIHCTYTMWIQRLDTNHCSVLSGM